MRKTKRLKQKELSKMLNLSKQTISAYETGVAIPPTDSLIKLAEIYNCSVDYLLCRTDNRKGVIKEVEFINIDGKLISKEEAAEYVRFARQVRKISEEAKWKPEEI